MEHTRSTAGTNGDQDRGFMNRVRERASAQLNTQKDQATEGIGSAVSAVRQSTQKLRDERHDTVANYIESAADQLDRFATRLKEKNVSELFDDAQRFARRQPGLFIGGAFFLGLLGSRFLKSSDTDRHSSQTWNEPSHARTRFDEPTYRRATAIGTSGPSLASPPAGPVDTPGTVAEKVTGRGASSPARRPTDG